MWLFTFFYLDTDCKQFSENCTGEILHTGNVQDSFSQWEWIIEEEQDIKMRTWTSVNVKHEHVFACVHALGLCSFILHSLRRLSQESALSSILSYKDCPITTLPNSIPDR